MLKSLRSRLFLLLLLVGLPSLLSSYVIAETALQATVDEKQAKLFGAAHILEQQLRGSYDDILRRHHAENADKETQIRILNEALAEVTDEVAGAYEGIGVGFYDRKLDAIVTYGPSAVYADKVGLPIGADHQGREVMATGIPRVQEGELVRGKIMNAMYPVKRNDEVIGYVWANELTVEIETQIRAIAQHIYLTMFAGMLVGGTGIVYVLHRLMADINRVKTGLAKIKESLSYKIAPPDGEIGEIAVAINSMADSLAEKEKLQEQVQRADRLAVIGEVAAGLAHEIRNPLMAIKGFAELQGETVNREERHEYSQIIVGETNRMNQLIEQLLCFSRPSSDLVEVVNVNRIIENTLVLAAMRASGTKIKFRHDLARQLPEVVVNEEQLRQVLLNLLINAIQAMDKIGEIMVRSSFNADENVVQVSIADTGSGIAPENLGKLFDPFFTTKEGGTGLGLSVAQHIMVNWGGVIRVASELDHGSTFTLNFPVGRSEAFGNDARS
jgi:signal transduction histidine kinase